MVKDPGPKDAKNTSLWLGLGIHASHAFGPGPSPAAGGAKEPRFTEEAKLALQSKDPRVLAAVLALAKGLKDDALIAQAQQRARG